VGLFDWLGGRERGNASGVQPAAWHVFREADEIVVEDGRGTPQRAPLRGARTVRVVPLTGGNHHQGPRAGWQVTLSNPAGDVLVGKAQGDWRSARELARQVCDLSKLPLDELTERMFSQVGRYTPAADGQ
jgi:hypothetical protein